jgi:adenosylcobinamide-phosphate synthase
MLMGTVIHPLNLAVSVVLDLCFGDPRWLPHPVRWIGWLTGWLDRVLYPKLRSSHAEFVPGMILCSLYGVTFITATLAIPALVVLTRKFRP